MQRLSKEHFNANKQSQLFLRLANNALVGVGVVQQNRFVFVNRRFAQMVGYERHELLNLDSAGLVIPKLSPETIGLAEQQNEQLLETELLHFEGHYVDTELCLIRIQYEGADATVIFFLNITERKKHERSAQLAALVYENTCEAIIVTDENGVVVDVNPAFTRITGYEPEDILGRSMNLLSSGRQGRAFYKKMWRELKTTGRWKGDIWNRAKDGTEYAERLNISTCYNEDGTVFRRIGLFFDITEDKEKEEHIWRQAHHDHLTGLPNRQMFQGRLHKAMAEAQEQGKEFALIFLDLDLFKDVNDTLGHDVGDLLLKEASKRLLSCVRESDTVARIGGDEFTVIVVDVPNQAIVERICKQILIEIAKPYHFGEHTVSVSASIGITMYPEDASDAGELLKNADMAMYAAKECGRNQYCFFIPAMSEAIQARMLFSQHLQTAIAENQFVLYYQPIINMQTTEVQKFEALIRWRHPELGLVPPSEYIPFAEDSGLIVDIGHWVFHTAIQQVKQWQDQGHNFQLSINVSPTQFYANGLNSKYWLDQIQQAGIETSSLIIEITERVLLEDSPLITQNLREFRQAGIQIALDDFGTGFSSLTYLKRHPIDLIKIDQSFVRNLAPGSEDLALCEAMIVMAQKLGLEVIAEGVEGPQQELLLLEAGCELGQGYLYSPPIPVQELELWLAERNARPVINNKIKDQATIGQLPQRT